MINQNILSAYCFLAALTENNNDLYNHVYVPVCKRALSEYSRRGKEFGAHTDIKDIILEIYGINVPESIVCKLIRGAEASLSRRKKEEIKLKVLENGQSFQLEKWAFTDLDDKYNKSKREANAIEEAFSEFIKTKKTFNEEVPSFNEFLFRYKTRLSSFFIGEISQIERNDDETYYYHVEFLEFIQRSNHLLYRIAQDLYLGAIVAGFLEAGFDVDHRKPTNEIFFLDTPIILRALDLQNPNETNPILELIDLIRKTGSTPKILSITVEEIQRVINSAIESYVNKNPVTTIGEACKRKNKDKAWLMTFNINLVKNIEKILGITIEIVSTEFIKNNEKCLDIPELQEIRKCKGNAAHDVYSYLFVRMMRQTPVSLLQNAKVWFITTNPSLLNFNIQKKIANSVPEIVLPDMLTSLLWLKDPTKLVNIVKKIGLKELMASTLKEEVASKELIHEYDLQIRKLDDINDETYIILLEAVAHYSANSIEKFIETAETDIIKAKEKALQIVEEERNRKEEIQRKIIDAQDSEEREKAEKERFSAKLTEIENNLIETDKSSKLAIEELQKKTEEQDMKLSEQLEKIEKQEKIIGQQGTQIESIKSQFKKDLKLLIIGLGSLLLFILSFIFIGRIGSFIFPVSILTGSGWLWSFGSFGIHIYRLSKGK